MAKKIDFFCFWEAGYIGVNIYDKDGKFCNCTDLRLNEAKELLGQLHSAIKQYEDLDKVCEEHDRGVTEETGDE